MRGTVLPASPVRHKRNEHGSDSGHNSSNAHTRGHRQAAGIVGSSRRGTAARTSGTHAAQAAVTARYAADRGRAYPRRARSHVRQVGTSDRSPQMGSGGGARVRLRNRSVVCTGPQRGPGDAGAGNMGSSGGASIGPRQTDDDQTLLGAANRATGASRSPCFARGTPCVFYGGWVLARTHSPESRSCQPPATICTSTLRRRGPSNSQKWMPCHVPNTRCPSSTGRVTERPTRLALMWASEFPSL
jgi:hypothetical protein